MIRVMREQHEATSLSRKNGVIGTPFSGSTISPRAQIRVIREQHAAPESVMRRLEIAGGRNRFGEANYRAVWGWSRAVPFILGDEAWTKLPNLKRLFDEISARPAAVRANALKDKHSFKTELDDDARRHMFPQNARLAS